MSDTGEFRRAPSAWVYRSVLGRAYGVLAVLTGVTLTVLGLTQSTSPGSPPEWVFVVLGFASLVSGAGMLRSRVIVGPPGIDFARSIRVTRIPWHEVDRFQKAPVHGLLVLLVSGDSVVLPCPSVAGRRRKASRATALCEQLEDLRAQYQSVA